MNRIAEAEALSERSCARVKECVNVGGGRGEGCMRVEDVEGAAVVSIAEATADVPAVATGAATQSVVPCVTRVAVVDAAA